MKGGSFTVHVVGLFGTLLFELAFNVKSVKVNDARSHAAVECIRQYIPHVTCACPMNESIAGKLDKKMLHQDI